MGQYRDRRAEGRPQGPSLSLDVEVGAAAQGEVLVGLGGRGSGVTSVAKPLGKERETNWKLVKSRVRPSSQSGWAWGPQGLGKVRSQS